MASEQGGADGGIESNRRQVRPHGDEPMTENEVQTGSPSPEQADQAKYDDRTGQFHPRRYSSPSSRSETPHAGSAALSRNPSNMSTATAVAEAAAAAAATAPFLETSLPNLSPEPPVTKATLSELDVSKILLNPKLRHDINFDPELHFRPNLDGDKGKRKQDRANQFWNTLLEQLAMFVTDRAAFLAEYGQETSNGSGGAGGDWCLPSLLRAVKDIIQTLVPVRDRAYLDEGLDVDLLMQQFDRGVADLEKLASWLSQVLKSHCAPMRDEWVDEMYGQLSRGNRENDLHELVKGMRNLLNVLEAMKLDVANHQIRCLRPVLIEDTVHFEQKFHSKRMRQSKMRMDSAPAVAWYRQAWETFAPAMTRNRRQEFGDTAVFFDAMTRLLLPSTCDRDIAALQVFHFDEDRLYKLRSDLLDGISLEICMRMYEELDARTRQGQQNVTGQSPPLSIVPADDDAAMLSWSREMNFNFGSLYAPPQTHGSRPNSFVFSDAGSSVSSTSSARSSVIFPAATTTSSNTTTLSSFSSSVSSMETHLNRSRDLYKSLVALLQTAPPTPRHTSRWQSLAPDMALQVLRTTSASMDLLPAFEAELASHLCDFSSALYQDVESQFHARLMADVGRRVSEYKNLAGVNLFAVATGGRIAAGSGRAWETGKDNGSSSGSSDSSTSNGGGMDGGEPSTDYRSGSSGNLSREVRDEAGMEDMATRVAHLGVLHWRVWSTILYNPCLENSMSPPPPQQQQQFA